MKNAPKSELILGNLSLNSELLNCHIRGAVYPSWPLSRFTVANVLPKLCPWMCHREELCGVHKEASTPDALSGISADASSWRTGPCGGRSPELRFCYSSAIVLGKGQRCEIQNKSQTSLSVADSNDTYCAGPGRSSEIWGREILGRMFWCWIFIEKDIFTLPR